MFTFYLDENISLRIVPPLTAAGYHVVTYIDMGLNRANDDVQLFTARTNDWVLVTHNGNDFALLHDALHRWGVGNPHSGILILPDNIPNRAQVQELDVFAATGLPVAGELYEWDPQFSWIRRPFPPRR